RTRARTWDPMIKSEMTPQQYQRLIDNFITSLYNFLMSPASPKPKGAIKLYRGVSIYQVEGSQNWYIRVWDRERQRYIVKTTGVRTAVKAREVAKEFALEMLQFEKPVDREFTFRHFALKCLWNSS